MPLDASIYNQVGQGAVKPLNQLDAMTNAYALQNAQLSGQAKQQEFTDDQAMRSAYKESGGDSNKYSNCSTVLALVNRLLRCRSHNLMRTRFVATLRKTAHQRRKPSKK